MSSIDPKYLREIIMDHYQYPRNKKLTLKDCTFTNCLDIFF